MTFKPDQRDAEANSGRSTRDARAGVRRAAQPLLEPGATLRGQNSSYTVSGVLGKGSFATAFLGECRRTFRPVALKVAPSSPAVEREIASLSALNHPNIVSILDVIRIPGATCTVLEFVEGVELYDFLQSQPSGTLREDLVRVIIEQLLDALVYMHAKGILHRDVKLDNILVESKTGLVKLIDFNLSAPFSNETTYTDPCGSIRYAAPTVVELASSGLAYPADGGWPDVYSLAVCTYSLLTGYFPFRGETAEEALDDYLLAFDARGGFGLNLIFPEGVSEAAKEFVRTGLDSRFRFRAVEMKGHRWLREPLQASKDVLDGLEGLADLSVGSPPETLVGDRGSDDEALQMDCWTDQALLAMGCDTPVEPSAPPLDVWFGGLEME